MLPASCWWRGARRRPAHIRNYYDHPGCAGADPRTADPTLLVGTGTVPYRATAEQYLRAGARFIVAPWVDAFLAAPCRAANAVLMLGALTPGEVRTALALRNPML